MEETYLIKVTMLIMLFNGSCCEDQQLYYRLTVLWNSKKAYDARDKWKVYNNYWCFLPKKDIQVTKVKDYNLLACNVGY